MIQLISYVYLHIYYNDSVLRICRPFNKFFNGLLRNFELFVLEFYFLIFLLFVNLKLRRNQFLLILFVMKGIAKHSKIRVILIASLLICLLLPKRLYFDKR